MGRGHAYIRFWQMLSSCPPGRLYPCTVHSHQHCRRCQFSAPLPPLGIFFYCFLCTTFELSPLSKLPPNFYNQFSFASIITTIKRINQNNLCGERAGNTLEWWQWLDLRGHVFFSPNTFQMFLNECYFGNWGGSFLPAAPYSCNPFLKKTDPEYVFAAGWRGERLLPVLSQILREKCPAPKWILMLVKKKRK